MSEVVSESTGQGVAIGIADEKAVWSVRENLGIYLKVGEYIHDRNCQ